MAEINLTQTEAHALIAMGKHRSDIEQRTFPMGGESLVVPLHSADRREQFLLDISRARIDLRRGKFQNRARQVVILLRLDFGGPPHRNPDDEEIPCPHLHVYREGYGDKWAIPVPIEYFPRLDDLSQTLDDFMMYCNITQPPYIEAGLF
ncbi:MAG TPA: hypothetical protein DCM28_18815 [Phycisphaerales bacterium]|nr:hypothetical protein [Phycisphaerales bacterium]HCD31576.1 hypothetical protein [Phycisphaerales bacterium]|tara:strand:- start:327 stop:773 length:447 start_codon:yes stop_codon:yes gene_type:complete